ncbi:Asd/ArgC dimerization domain-containing protein [Vibrio lentus]|nr:Asd/ArgC dimerization domain-containing protein [Vibrio lentus]
MKRENGQSKEEWKAALKEQDSRPRWSANLYRWYLCSNRCNRQAITLKHSLLSLSKTFQWMKSKRSFATHNDWVKVVPNDRDITAQELTPAKVTGTMSVPVGRLRKMSMGNDFQQRVYCW